MQLLTNSCIQWYSSNRAGASSFDSCIIVNLKPFQSGPKALHCRWCRPEVPRYCKIFGGFQSQKREGLSKPSACCSEEGEEEGAM